MKSIDEIRTPFDRFLFNWQSVDNIIGARSFTVAIKCVNGSFVPSMSGGAYLVLHDFLVNETGHNCVIYAHKIMQAVYEATKKMCAGEDFDSKKDQMLKWMQENPDESSLSCPIRLYYTDCVAQNNDWKDRMRNQLMMFFGDYTVVIHLVRDATMDSNAGGYFIQIHIYNWKGGTIQYDSELDAKAKNAISDAFRQINLPRCRTKVLTNPSVFARLLDWMTRSYFRFNTVVLRVVMNIYWAITGKISGTAN